MFKSCNRSYSYLPAEREKCTVTLNLELFFKESKHGFSCIGVQSNARHSLQQSPRVNHTAEPPRRTLCNARHFISQVLQQVHCCNFGSSYASGPETQGSSRTGGGLGWTEATTGIYPIAPLSGGGAALFISWHSHWDYGNAGGLKHKHSPLSTL